MSGFGALDFMNKTLKNNRGLVKKINVFGRIKLYNSALMNLKIKYKKASTQEAVERLRLQTLAESRRNTLIQIMKLIGVLLLIFTIIGMLIGGVIIGKS